MSVDDLVRVAYDGVVNLWEWGEMRHNNQWARFMTPIDREDEILLNMFDQPDDFARLLPYDMKLSIMKMMPGYACEVFRHWVTTGEWVWSDKANREYVRPSLRRKP